MGKVQKLVVVITGVETREVLERWVFNVETDRAALAPGCVVPCRRVLLTRTQLGPTTPCTQPNPAQPHATPPRTSRSAVRVKSAKDIQSEIQAIIRQITASVTFLPLLEEPCTFDLLVYTDEDAEVPRAWEESDPRYIAHSAEVRLRSFTTTIHKVAPTVSYRAGGAGGPAV